MSVTHILVDFENVPIKSLPIFDSDAFRICIFLGPNNKSLNADVVKQLHQFGNRAEYITLEKSGKNALDFYIAFYLGRLSAVNPGDKFQIISKDQGFETLIEHLQAKGIDAIRMASVEGAQVTSIETERVAATMSTPKTAVAPKSSGAAKNKSKGYANKSVKALAELAWEKLAKRKKAKPTTIKKLLSTLNSDFSSELNDDRLQKIVHQLSKNGHFRIVDKTVNYV